ncbi:MAG: Uma2 family endonuclease, partial [Bryobacteraceae bacterium]
DGVVRQKPVPTSYHSFIESLLCVLLAVRAKQFFALPELHVRLRPRKFLVPDLAVVRREMFEHPYPTKPVYLCVEIVSPDDRPEELLAKCEEYHAWGVPYCWVIDPEQRAAWIYDRHAESVKLRESESLIAGEIEIPLTDLFSQLPQ